jgi:exoribonuclease-2
MKMTYDEVDNWLSGPGNCCDMGAMLMAMHKAALARKATRERNGAISLNMPESSIQVDVQGNIDNISIKSVSSESSKSKEMVSEMMILAGEIVALEGQHRGLALPYRGQEITVMPSQEELENAPNQICRMIILRNYLLSSTSNASGPRPHNGLGITAYVQATSPIRRFGDLLAHWQIKAALRGSATPFDTIKLQEILDELQLANRALNKYERSVSDFWVSKYFEKELSTNPNAAWDAILLKWIHQDNGIASIFIESLGLEMIARIRAPARIGSLVTVQCTATAPDIQRVVLTDKSQ